MSICGDKYYCAPRKLSANAQSCNGVKRNRNVPLDVYYYCILFNSFGTINVTIDFNSFSFTQNDHHKLENVNTIEQIPTTHFPIYNKNSTENFSCNALSTSSAHISIRWIQRMKENNSNAFYIFTWLNVYAEEKKRKKMCTTFRQIHRPSTEITIRKKCDWIAIVPRKKIGLRIKVLEEILYHLYFILLRFFLNQISNYHLYSFCGAKLCALWCQWHDYLTIQLFIYWIHFGAYVYVRMRV